MAEKARMQFSIHFDSFFELSSDVSIERYNFFKNGMYFLAKFLNPAFDLVIAGFALVECFIHTSIRFVSP